MLQGSFSPFKFLLPKCKKNVTAGREYARGTPKITFALKRAANPGELGRVGKVGGWSGLGEASASSVDCPLNHAETTIGNYLKRWFDRLTTNG